LKGYKHTTQEEFQRILASYQRTRSTALTAQELSLPHRHVTGLLGRAGIPLTKAHGGACYLHQAEIEQWAKEGVSLSEIGRRIGTKHQLVKKFLVEHGIEYVPYRQAMENNTFWRGGRMTDEDGYILVKCPEHPHKDRHGYVREHRLVMEQMLSRYLLPTEVVHHKNGLKFDNSPENLEVFGSNAKHLAMTRKGQVPKWSDEGKARMPTGVEMARRKKQIASRQESKTGDCQSPRTDDLT